MKLARLAFAFALATACSVEALDLSGKSCPCTDGWVCDTTVDECVPEGTILEPPHEAGADVHVDGPPQDAGGAITVLDLVPKWETANGIRWEWKAFGDRNLFASYEIVTGPRAEDVRARSAATTKVYDPTTNPELGAFGGRDPNPATLPVLLWTVTDGHPENTTVFAQVIAHDKNGGVSTSDVASAATFRPRAVLELLGDEVPEGGVLTPAGAKMVTTNTFDASAKCIEDVVACQGGSPCATEIGAASIDGTDAVPAMDVSDFPTAFLEIAIRGGVAPGTYADVVLVIGADACGTACRDRFSGVSFGAKQEDWRLVQVPLRYLKTSDGAGGGLSYAQLGNRKRLAGFLVTGSMADGVPIGIDQVRIRW